MGGLPERYTMPDFKVRGLDHSLAYRGLDKGSIDVIDLYSTDPEIITYDLQVLDDDLGHFPKYEAIIVYRADLEERFPQLIAAFKQFEGKIDSELMAKMNADSRVRRIPENKIANEFIHAAINKTWYWPRCLIRDGVDARLHCSRTQPSICYWWSCRWQQPSPWHCRWAFMPTNAR